MGKKTEVPRGGKGETRFGSITGVWCGQPFEGAGMLRPNEFLEDFGFLRPGSVDPPELCPIGTDRAGLPPHPIYGCDNPPVPGSPCEDGVATFDCWYDNGGANCFVPNVPEAVNITTGSTVHYVKFFNDTTDPNYRWATVDAPGPPDDYQIEIRPTQETFDDLIAGGGAWRDSTGAIQVVRDNLDWICGDTLAANPQDAGPVAQGNPYVWRIYFDAPTAEGFYHWDFEVFYNGGDPAAPCVIGETTAYLDVGPAPGEFFAAGHANVLNPAVFGDTPAVPPVDGTDMGWRIMYYDANGNEVGASAVFGSYKDGPYNTGELIPDPWNIPMDYDVISWTANKGYQIYILVDQTGNASYARVWRYYTDTTGSNPPAKGELEGGANYVSIPNLGKEGYDIRLSNLNDDDLFTDPDGNIWWRTQDQRAVNEFSTFPYDTPAVAEPPRQAPDPLPHVCNAITLDTTNGYLNDDGELVIDFTYEDYPVNYADLPTADWPRLLSYYYDGPGTCTIRTIIIDGWGDRTGYTQRALTQYARNLGSRAAWKVVKLIIEEGATGGELTVGWSNYIGLKWPAKHYEYLDQYGNYQEYDSCSGYIRDYIVDGVEVDPHGETGRNPMPIVQYPAVEDPRGVWLPDPEPNGLHRYEMVHWVDRITSLTYRRYDECVEQGLIVPLEE